MINKDSIMKKSIKLFLSASISVLFLQILYAQPTELVISNLDRVRGCYWNGNELYYSTTPPSPYIYRHRFYGYNGSMEPPYYNRPWTKISPTAEIRGYSYFVDDSNRSVESYVIYNEDGDHKTYVHLFINGQKQPPRPLLSNADLIRGWSWMGGNKATYLFVSNGETYFARQTFTGTDFLQDRVISHFRDTDAMRGWSFHEGLKYATYIEIVDGKAILNVAPAKIENGNLVMLGTQHQDFYDNIEGTFVQKNGKPLIKVDRVPGNENRITITNHQSPVPVIYERNQSVNPNKYIRTLYPPVEITFTSANSLTYKVPDGPSPIEYTRTIPGNFLIKNRFRHNEYLTMVNNQLSKGPKPSNILDGLWNIIPVDDTYFMIKRAGTSNEYLHISRARLSCSTLPNDENFRLAHWKKSYTDSGFLRIVNRKEPSLSINTEKGPLVASYVPPGYWTSQWKLIDKDESGTPYIDGLNNPNPFIIQGKWIPLGSTWYFDIRPNSKGFWIQSFTIDGTLRQWEGNFIQSADNPKLYYKETNTIETIEFSSNHHFTHTVYEGDTEFTRMADPYPTFANPASAKPDDEINIVFKLDEDEQAGVLALAKGETGDFSLEDKFKTIENQLGNYQEGQGVDAANQLSAQFWQDSWDTFLEATDAGGGDKRITALVAGGILLVNAFAQPFIYAGVEYNLKVFVVNMTDKPLKISDLHKAQGSYIYGPKNGVIPAKVGDQAPASLLIFSKDHGYNGAMGALQFGAYGNMPLIRVGYAIPYRDKLTIHRENVCGINIGNAQSESLSKFFSDNIDAHTGDGVATTSTDSGNLEIFTSIEDGTDATMYVVIKEKE